MTRAILIIVFFLSMTAVSEAQFNPIERLSVRANGEDANGASEAPNISASDDGRYVVFASVASNLVENDNNELSDIFLFDRTQGTVTKITEGVSLPDTDGASTNPVISADGLFVAYQSEATNIVIEDTNESTDIFLYDVTNLTTTRLSVDSAELESNGDSVTPVIDATGSFIAFASDATNLVPEDDNSARDIFLRNVATTETTRVSVISGGNEADGASEAPSISGDGTRIVFQSMATDLVAGDSNEVSDVFVHDTSDNSTVRVSVNGSGAELNFGASMAPAISADGTTVAYQSTADDIIDDDTNLVSDIYVYTIADGSVERVSINTEEALEPNGPSTSPTLSADGRFVTFLSAAEDVVEEDNNGVIDIFTHDRTDDETVRVSVDNIGTELFEPSSAPSINSNGQFISFVSTDATLDTEDRNDLADIFVLNTQCLLAPPGITELDTDSDGTDDCSDACPEDAAKIALGACGCGTPETDTDSDGTPDCNDACSSDPLKQEVGTCGCGVADDDTNGNGVLDCLEPDSSTVPRKPVLRFNRRRGVLRVIIPEEFPGFRYQIQVRRGRRVVARKRSRGVIVRFRGVPRGRLRVRYRILLIGGGRSQFSPTTRVRTR